ncbi:hypothetical protein BUY79_04555 [Staphylococcus equorum]|nr:hypothetical protein BUY79_04555 [Staphylococcus equorum]PTF12553.1 hypothetical protein BUY81_02030 [Staphylococcus equorum]
MIKKGKNYLYIFRN